ncbi:hypothetical protein [Salirhabdus salicampi]|nr:hypothetical protein [Salirhabdus salicampi]MCP8617944.1 hypothetical protein [Salirhabdus salicampi]
MVFTWILGVIGAVWSTVFLDNPSPTGFFAGFTAGTLMDLYRLLKKEKQS